MWMVWLVTVRRDRRAQPRLGRVFIGGYHVSSVDPSSESEHDFQAAVAPDAWRSAALLKAIVDSSDDAIISKDLSGVITSWNQSAERLFGYTADEVVGRPITLLIPPDRLDEEPKILDQLRRGERVDHFETMRLRKDRSQLHISLTISPIRDGGGRIVGASKIARDITERKQAEVALSNRHAQFETLLNQSPLGVYLIDSDFRIREVNPLARPFFGDISDLIGRDFDEVIHRLWHKRFADEIVARFRHVLDTGDPYIALERGELRIDRGATEYYDWRLSRITLADGRYGVVCYFRDISAEVQARTALRDYAERLQKADQRKNEFLATLAHELRNPLAPIRNAVEILKRPDLTAEDFQIARRITENQLNQMVRLVDDLLDISRISSGKIRLRKERLTVASIVDQALQNSQPHVDAAGHRVSLSLPPATVYLEGDPLRLAQVVSNLINNACKYSDNNGRIEIKAAVETEKILILSVKDTGIGIAAEHLPRIFELFSQVGAVSNRSQDGLGIGLALVRGLVELHGGSVEARSEGIGKGSDFIVRLPIAAAVKEEVVEDRGHDSSVSSASGGKRILVVDDNRVQAKSLGMLLEYSGHEVKVALDGPSALATLEDFVPDLALVDLGLPHGMSGHDLARQIRAQPRFNNTILIAQTGWGRDEDRERSRVAGFNYHLVKPIDHERLHLIIDGKEPR
jgi:PAS domain S-box-containing protein